MKKKNDPRETIHVPTNSKKKYLPTRPGRVARQSKQVFIPPWLSCRETCRRLLCQNSTLVSTWLLLSFWKERRKTRRVFASGATRKICRTSRSQKWWVWGDRGPTAHAYITRGAPTCRKCVTYPNFTKHLFQICVYYSFPGRWLFSVQLSACRRASSSKDLNGKARDRLKT